MQNDDLITRAQRGDKSAFAALLQEHYDAMLRMAYKYCGNRQDAEDITQEACIKLARNLGSFRFRSAFTSWLYRLVINTARDFHRAQKSTLTLEDGHIGTGGADAETTVYANEIMAQIHALPENEKTALLLVMSEGMTHKEAAAVMECRESTVSWYIHEARKKLGVKEQKERRHG